MAVSLNDVCLMVLNPRFIEESIKSIKELPVDKVWFSGFTELELCNPINKFINKSNYKYYSIISDDVIVPLDSFLKVVSIIDKYNLPVSGYCNLFTGSKEINCTKSQLTIKNEMYAEEIDYDWYSFGDLVECNEPFDSYYCGWCLTTMSRELWQKYPFTVNSYTKKQSDAESSYKMSKDGIHFKVHPTAFVKHLKTNNEKPLITNWIRNYQEVRLDLQ